MSARERLVLRMAGALPQSMAGSALADLDAFKAEVLREAAAKIRKDIGDFLAEWPDEPRRSPFVNGMSAAADLIDPDKDTE